MCYNGKKFRRGYYDREQNYRKIRRSGGISEGRPIAAAENPAAGSLGIAELRFRRLPAAIFCPEGRKSTCVEGAEEKNTKNFFKKSEFVTDKLRIHVL